MGHLSVHRNRHASSKSDVPFLLDVQSDVLAALATRVVVPLHLRKTLAYKPMARLMPEFDVEGKKVVMLTPQLAGIAAANLGEQVASLSSRRDDVLAALDLLITGF